MIRRDPPRTRRRAVARRQVTRSREASGSTRRHRERPASACDFVVARHRDRARLRRSPAGGRAVERHSRRRAAAARTRPMSSPPGTSRTTSTPSSDAFASSTTTTARSRGARRRARCSAPRPTTTSTASGPTSTSTSSSTSATLRTGTSSSSAGASRTGAGRVLPPRRGCWRPPCLDRGGDPELDTDSRDGRVRRLVGERARPTAGQSRRRERGPLVAAGLGVREQRDVRAAERHERTVEQRHDQLGDIRRGEAGAQLRVRAREHLGVDGARTQADRADALPLALGGNRLGEPDDAVLGECCTRRARGTSRSRRCPIAMRC